jgi:acyl-CoA synthetase (AMP-forming)/AMP-acid ligase II
MQRQPIDFTEFVAWCRERMANFKVPRYLEPLEALPLTGSNKVSKVDLREIAAAKGIGESV